MIYEVNINHENYKNREKEILERLKQGANPFQVVIDIFKTADIQIFSMFGRFVYGNFIGTLNYKCQIENDKFKIKIITKVN